MRFERQSSTDADIYLNAIIARSTRLVSRNKYIRSNTNAFSTRSSYHDPFASKVAYAVCRRCLRITAYRTSCPDITH